MGGGHGWGYQEQLLLPHGVRGVLSYVPDIIPHPRQGCLSSGSLDSVPNFPGEQGTCKVHLQVSFPRAECELPLEATVLPGDMAPQIPASCPEKKPQIGCSGSSRIMDEEIKMMLASFFLISV